MQFGQAVSRLRAARTDDGYGGIQLDWTSTDTLPLPDSAMAPGTGDDQLDSGRLGVEILWTVYVPGTGHDVAALDRLSTPYGIYEVDGEPAPWSSPYTGRNPGTVVRLKRIDG